VINGFVNSDYEIAFSDLLYFNHNFVDDKYSDRLIRTEHFCKEYNLPFVKDWSCPLEIAQCSYMYTGVPYSSISTQFFFFQHIRYAMFFLMDYTLSEEHYHMVIGVWHEGEIKPFSEFIIPEKRVLFVHNIYKYSIVILSLRFLSCFSLSEIEVYRVYGCKFNVHETYASIQAAYRY